MARIITAIIETAGPNAGAVAVIVAGCKGKQGRIVQDVFEKVLGGKVLVTKKPESTRRAVSH